MKNKGITLLALIVTVIIMIILASVSIRIITSGGIIDKTREAAKLTDEAAEREQFELAKVAATDYITGEIDLDKLKENLPEDWEWKEDWCGNTTATTTTGNDIVINEEINLENLVQVEDGHGNTYIYYRLDKATEKEIIECQKRGILPFLGDVNCDGIVDEEDVSKVSKFVGGTLVLTEEEEKYADVNKDKDISTVDLGMIRGFIEDKLYQRMWAIALELEIDYSETMLEDEENGNLYYIENEVTIEQARKLEKYGIKKTMYGDMNFDGKLTEEDVEIITGIYGGTKDGTDNEIKIGDFDKDGWISSDDAITLNNLVNKSK